MKVLVTGGAGFIGSHLVDLLLGAEHEVAVVDDLSGGSLENLYHCLLDVQFYPYDVRRPELIDAAVKDFQPEVIYHLAANAAENKAQFSPIDVTSRNYQAFIATLTAAIRHQVKRFIFTSSIAVYGAQQTPFKETDEPKPEDLYGITKLAAEQSLKVMADIHGIEYVILRPHNVFGPRQNMRDPYRNVVTIFINSLMRETPCILYGNGEMIRQFTYIDTVTEALTASLTCSSGLTINVGDDMAVKVAYLLGEIELVSGALATRQEEPARPHEVLEAVADHTNQWEFLRINPPVKLNADERFRQQLKETWDWCALQGLQQPAYTELELSSPKIPENWRHGART